MGIINKGPEWPNQPPQPPKKDVGFGVKLTVKIIVWAFFSFVFFLCSLGIDFDTSERISVSLILGFIALLINEASEGT